MQKIVKITRKWLTTIPVKIREKLGLKEGEKLTVEVVVKEQFSAHSQNGGLCRAFRRHADIVEPKKEIDKLREEYQL